MTLHAGTTHATAAPESHAQSRMGSAAPQRAHVVGIDDARHTELAPPAARSSRGLWSHPLVRVLRNAAVGLTLLSVIPMAIVATGRGAMTPDTGRIVVQASQVDHLRALRMPVDPAVTPQEAGAALRRLSSSKPNAVFPATANAVEHDRPWQRIDLESDMFPTMRTPQFKGPVNFMVIAKTSGGYSPKEMAYLRTIAEAPIWKDFDAVATAGAVDMVGGLYQTPFSQNASIANYPIIAFNGSKQLAFAAVSRAAYYQASGNSAEAERVLRTLVSFGFTLMDEGTTAIDGMLGRIIVDLGRDGLWHLYALAGRNEELMLVEPLMPASKVSVTQTRSALEVVADTRAPRSLRLNALSALTYQSCGSLRGMLMGPDSETTQAIAAARASMARYPSEQALFDLIERSAQRGPDLNNSHGYNPVVGIAQIVSAVTGNARFANCTAIASTIR